MILIVIMLNSDQVRKDTICSLVSPFVRFVSPVIIKITSTTISLA